jgi:hypothetical protein
MLKRLSLVILLAAAGFPGLADSAAAQSCRTLQLQMMQYQASREMRQYHRVRELMARSGCGGGQGFSLFERQRRAAPQRRATPQRRAVAQPRAPARERRAAAARRAEPRMSRVAGTFRTLCVRSCDGYYFPISFSTTRDRFEADQASCEQACPQGDAHIYYHRTSGEGPESMISLTGSAYADLATAFSYRKGLNPSCSCGQPAADDLLPAERGNEAAIAAAVPVPRPRLAPGQDPETLANRAGHFVPRFSATPLVASVEEVTPEGIRIIGPGEPEPVPVSPVPNDLETSLLWEGWRPADAGRSSGVQ